MTINQLMIILDHIAEQSEDGENTKVILWDSENGGLEDFEVFLSVQDECCFQPKF